ncbi:MAG: branched-chain amino acid ABC transporter permease [Chloroflexi bacterium]|nr:branched-chain amino acid ABC transporter permease [Chloroflexota bacterium]
MSIDVFVQQAINALSLGSIYALLALGLAMVYSTLGILNFAYGELITIVGYTMYFGTQAGLPFVVAAGLGIVAAGAASVLMQLAVFRPLRGANFVTLLFASFALSQVLQGFFLQAISPRSKGIPTPELFSEFITIGGVRIGVLALITLAVALLAMLLLFVFMRSSRAGLQMRASAQDLTTARILGVRTDRVIPLAFLVSGLLAGVGGVLWIARTTSVNPGTGFTPILVSFVAIVLGGLGSIPGAVIGAFVFGALEIMLQAYLPSAIVPFQFALALVAVAIVLYARPEGLLGRRIDVKV